jgi:hypothetical protein
MNASPTVLAENCAMHKVHTDFGHPSLGTNWLFSLTVVLWSRGERRGSEQHYHLALCSLTGIIVSSQHYTLVYWMMGLVIIQPISHKLFTTTSPVTHYYTILYYTTNRSSVELS